MLPDGPIIDPYVDAERHALWAVWEEACQGTLHSFDRALEALRVATTMTTLVPMSYLKIFAAFEARASGEWFLQGTQNARLAKTDALTYFAQESMKLTPLCVDVDRPPRFAQRIFAHLSSGRRREGDVQQCLEKKGATMLSIDIIFHLTMGDLANPDTYAVFVKAIEQGLIVGFLAGPTCETWSRARQRAVSDDVRWKRTETSAVDVATSRAPHFDFQGGTTGDFRQ